MTTRPTPVVPGDLFARHQTIKGLRELADFLETNPGVPVQEFGWTVAFHQGVSQDAQTDAVQRSEVDRVADLLGVTVLDEIARGGHYRASRSFGRITYEAVHVPARQMAEYRAHYSYRDNVTLDESEGEAA